MSLSIVPDYPDMTIQLIVGDTAPIQVVLTSRVTTAPCPRCGTLSTRVRGIYQRQPQELPWGTAAVVLQLTVHRFRCDAPACPQKIFCERLSWVPVYQRRTTACIQRILTLAWEMSASAAQRVAETLGIHVSRSTINRWIRQDPRSADLASVSTDATVSADADPPVTIVGIDDWAWKKGQRYGTLVVDLRTHQPVDVLPDRSAATVAAWLRQHPAIRVISRDRGGTYAKGAREGAPQAQQVADRFHLIKNWHDHTADLIGPWVPKRPDHPRGNDDPTLEEPPSLASERVADHPVGALAPMSPAARRQGRWEAVEQLWKQGRSITAIADELHCDPKTVRKDLAADRPRTPQASPHRPNPSEDQLLAELWQGQRMTAQDLWEAARTRGYGKSLASVSRWLRQRRGPVNRGCPAARNLDSMMEDSMLVKPHKPWTGRQWAHFLGTGWLHLPRRATNALSQRLAGDPLYRKAWTLTRHFQTMVAHRCGEKSLAAWCRLAESSGIPDFAAFARSLRQDWEAIVAGVTVEWSQGPVGTQPSHEAT